MYETVIFDLDGTLVDSAPGIVGAIVEAAHAEGYCLDRNLVHRRIGPPAASLIRELLPAASQAARERIQAGFRRRYDEAGYMDCRLYEGCRECLRAFSAAGMTLMVATNKPEKPTAAVLAAMGISQVFTAVVSTSASGALWPKSEAVRRLLGNQSRDGVVLVGDSLDDHRAAKDNQLDFLLAAWGYRPHDVVATDSGVRRAGGFDELLTKIMA